MIIKNISKPIQETLKARERALARKEPIQPNASINYTDYFTREELIEFYKKINKEKTSSKKKECNKRNEKTSNS